MVGEERDRHRTTADAKVVATGAMAGGPVAIGVTGHRPRRLAGVDLAALRKQIDSVLAAIAAAEPTASFRLVGSLAEGADMITADAALARGWQVDAVLPFTRADYARDFAASGAVETFYRHLDAAGSIFELPGDRDGPNGEATAYERAGRIVLAQSDLLLALWDGHSAAGRGGAAQIVAEAVTQGLPVLVIDPHSARPPAVLWSGLNAHVLGPEALETVARGDASVLPQLFAAMTASEPLPREPRTHPLARLLRRPLLLAYPLLLAATGVRRFRMADFAVPKATVSPAGDAFDARLASVLSPRFDEADLSAGAAARLFRGAFVSNYTLAALAVVLSLAGLAAAAAFKPLLALGEFGSTAAILLITRAGGRSHWHDRWLRRRRLAERLRCLGLSSMLGDLMLFRNGVMSGDERLVARALGLPPAVADRAYLAEVHRRLIALLDDQIAYRVGEAERMHQLEHRLHRFGGALFLTVALVCGCVFTFEMLSIALPHGAGGGLPHLPLGVTLLSASLPAIGAAIYGIRMQGDFAGSADRNTALNAQLRAVRLVATDDPPTFDALLRLVRRTTDLLEQDLGQWFRSSSARPLALPG